jgi:hypothetical protein
MPINTKDIRGSAGIRKGIHNLKTGMRDEAKNVVERVKKIPLGAIAKFAKTGYEKYKDGSYKNIKKPSKVTVAKTFTKAAAAIVSGLAGKGISVEDRRMPGEMHGLLQLPSGKFAFANYMGPGTQLMTRLKRGDQGLTPVDRLAKKHDIDYSLATTPEDVVRADRAMIMGLRGARNAGEKTFNLNQGRLMIPKAAYERLTGRTLFNDLKGPGPNKAYLLSQRNR